MTAHSATQTAASAATTRQSPIIPSIAISKASAGKAAGKAPPKADTAELIVLGRDASGKSHASWFDSEEAPLAKKAAGLMGMATLRVASADIRKLADRLPHGKVFASGKAFVPFVKGVLYTNLLDHLSAAEKDRLASLQMEQETKAAGPEESKVTADELPADWSKLKVGSVVVAWESKDDGWWLAKVVTVNTEDLYTLSWLDYPELPTIIRKRKFIALLHPSFGAA